MRKINLLVVAAAAIFFAACSPQNTNAVDDNQKEETTVTAIPHDSVITLTAVDMTMQTTLMQALQDRASIGRDQTFSPELISLEQLSSLLWAANGFNREDRRTAPSALNAQDVDIYVCFEFGAYLFNAKEMKLTRVTDKDILAEFEGGRQESTPAPVILALISDYDRYFIKDEYDRNRMGHCDASFVSANIGIYCAAAGLATRPRMGANWENVAKALNLSETQHGILNNPVGFAVKAE